MTDKIFLSANALLADSFLLARQIYDTGLKPDWIVGVWRGGTPVAMATHELFNYLGHTANHMAIQALSYNGNNEQTRKIKLRGIKSLIRRLKKSQQVLLIDDVFDTGRSFEAILNKIHLNHNDLKILTATVWYKPKNNKTQLTPDFYLKTTDRWIVFPHELMGLNKKELQQKPVLIP